MAAKLRVSLAEGIFEAEGDDAFVKEMHSEFKDYVGRFFGERPSSPPPSKPAPPRGDAEQVAEAESAEPDDGEQSSARAARSPSRRRRSSSSPDGNGSKKLKYEPKVLPDLKLPGLPDAFGAFDLKAHKDIILFCAHYLAHDAGIDPFTADHIFTCYRLLKLKPPTAFAQALYDARKVRHYIKFEKLDAISMTHMGDTDYEHHLKRKGEDA